MGDDKILKLSKKVPQFKNMYNEEGLVYYGLDGKMENVLPCKTFCKAMEPTTGRSYQARRQANLPPSCRERVRTRI